jgi:hypothetical protein
LDGPREPLAAPLNLSQVAVLNAASAKRFGQYIRRFDGISDRAVDAYPAQRQHDMGGIANEQQP